MVDDLKVVKLGKRVIRRQRPLHHKLDLPRVGLEAVTDLEADSPHHNIHEVLNLRERVMKDDERQQVLVEIWEGIWAGEKFPLCAYPIHRALNKEPKFEDER